MMNSFRRTINWHTRTRLAYINLVHRTRGYEPAFEEYRKLLVATRYRNERVINRYLRFCLTGNQLERIDEFVERLKSRPEPQNLPAFIRVFDFLEEASDHGRLAIYAGSVGSFGPLVVRSVQERSWYLDYQLRQRQHTEGSSSEEESQFERQLSIGSHIARGEYVEALESLTPTLFERFVDPGSEQLRFQNAKNLNDQKDPVVAAFLKYNRTAPLSQPGRTHGFSEFRLSEPSEHETAKASVTWSQYACDAVQDSLAVRWMRLARRREPERTIPRMEALLERSSFTNDSLVDAHLVLCDRYDRFDRINWLIGQLQGLRSYYDLDGCCRLIARALVTGDDVRLRLYASLVPYLREDIAQRYFEYEANGVAQPESEADLSDAKFPTTSIDSVKQRDIAAMIDTGYRYDEAAEHLRESLFVHGANARGNENALQIGNVVRILSVSRKPDPVLYGFLWTSIQRSLPPDSIATWTVILAANDYHLARKNLSASKALLDQCDLNTAPEQVALRLIKWMALHLPASSVVQHFQDWRSRHSASSPLVDLAYARALLAANRPEEALVVIGELNTNLLTAHLHRAETLTALGRMDTAVAELYSLPDPHFANEALWSRLLTISFPRHEDSFVRLWNAQAKNLSEAAYKRLSFQLSTQSEAIGLDWEEETEWLRKNYSIRTGLLLLTSAFTREEHSVFDELLAIVISRLPAAAHYDIESPLQNILNLLYKRGESDRAKSLVARLSPPKYGSYFEMIKAFSSGDPVRALDAREDHVLEQLTTQVDRELGNADRGDREILCPEQHIAGELYNSYFFRTEIKRRKSFAVICDERLLTIFQRCFKDIEFVPKAPRISITKNRTRFEGVPLDLSRYLDRASLDYFRRGAPFRISVSDQYANTLALGARKHGWLEPDLERAATVRSELERFQGKTLAGFAAASTTRSPVRDLSFVDLSHWGTIFALPDTVFINLNPAFDSEKAEEIRKRFEIEVYLPSIDLFNDFEGLLAIMSQLNFAVLPSNSLMDFAASIGLRTYVFSPTGMMANWTPPDSRRYVFSDKVEFFCGRPGEPKHELVRRLASSISEDFYLPKN